MKVQILSEHKFDLHFINKFATLMTLGNGYLGTRAAHEEAYTLQTRGMYVAGIYNKFHVNDTSDLVNLPDMIGMQIMIDGEYFSLLDGEILDYKRDLNLQNGELKREVTWKNNKGSRYTFVFQRFASKFNRHLFAMKLSVISLDKDSEISITTGIDAQQSNFGKQHIVEEKVMVFDEKIMQGIYSTTESKQVIAIATTVKAPKESHINFNAKNRQIMTNINGTLEQRKKVQFEKYGVVYTSLDNDLDGMLPENASLEAIQENSKASYDELLDQSTNEWKVFWETKRISVQSQQEFDQIALDFALYHLEIMTPTHDERFSVGAKGLTGEGYKGHVFWDTEIFILPFHLLNDSETARNLLRYRYLHLEQAKEKALQNGYKGALFPWESAFTGREETPEFAAINIRTGKRQKVASAIAEHHIVADIAFATVQYYLVTKDDAFMKNEGVTLLKETALFWLSRAKMVGNKYIINDVIGPDEYTEHIDNNAFTNYMAYNNVKQALYYMNYFNMMDEKFEQRGQNFLNNLYLPKPNENGIIPQDDTFLKKPTIDLTKYKKAQGSQGILLDYSRAEVNEMQILKQADVVMLLYLFPNLFDKALVAENLHYYEKHTIHDSSLSKAIHSIVAARCNDIEEAYQLFTEACLIDLGTNPHSSDEGIHAASLGAIWLATVFGFANVSINEEGLSLNPQLPNKWCEVSLPIQFQGHQLKVTITHNRIEVRKETEGTLSIQIFGTHYFIEDQIEISY
ncbi:glycoside hydrolase family 65 protein [Bacillus sp. JJ722]|uniref:glycoside hydrolase family 65 protein n=1 Tax=Bacillus sp. JJ722 TaxID=3122973 RepID=UPI0030008BE2